MFSDTVSAAAIQRFSGGAAAPKKRPKCFRTPSALWLKNLFSGGVLASLAPLRASEASTARLRLRLIRLIRLRIRLIRFNLRLIRFN